jgi:nucleolar protein 56
LIYLHPYVQNAKKEDRGKVARILANKISLAVRIDYYTKEDKREELKKDLEEKLKEIR